MTPQTAWRQFRELYLPEDRFSVRLLGIRGYFLFMGDPERNERGIYDDLICICTKDRFEGFRASTDPGRRYLKSPINPHGCASLKAGLWWYKKGHHRGHEAFIQNDKVTIDRLDASEKIVGEESGFFGINIHSGGPEPEVGSWSAGCQVIQSREGAWTGTWLKFKDMSYSLMDAYGQEKIPYLLVESLKTDGEGNL